jgi:uncharacterized protein (DUF924 family)
MLRSISRLAKRSFTSRVPPPPPPPPPPVAAAPPTVAASPTVVLDFFGALTMKYLFMLDAEEQAALDAKMSAALEPLHNAAAGGEHDNWAESPTGLLALVLLFDQVRQ